MDWFRPAFSSILLFAATLGLFFWVPTWAPVLSGTLLWAFTLARIVVLLALGFGLAYAAARGQPGRPVALLVAAPSVVLGGLLGVSAALEPTHLLVVAALALALSFVCYAGAMRGSRA